MSEITELVLKWLIPFLCGAFVSAFCAASVLVKSIRGGLQCLLRAEIIRQHEKWSKRGYCPIYAKESLTKAYKAYHALKGNDVATEMFEELIDLPAVEITHE